MLHINIICLGKIKEEYLKKGIDEYKKRLSRFCDLKITELIDEKIPENAREKEEKQIKEKEGKKIISVIKDKDFVIAMDLKGKEIDSIEMAKKIEEISNNYSDIDIIIGGSLGISEEVLNRANYKLSFSKLTFTHQLARILLLEQIYRSFKIINNEQYHK